MNLEPIKNQLLPGLDFAAYRALPGYSGSTVRVIERSPLACKHRLESPITSNALTTGSSVHTVIETRGAFLDALAVYPGAVRRGKEWDAFQADNAGRAIVKADEAEQLQSIWASVSAHPGATRYLNAPGESELSMTWADPGTGLPRRGRIDKLCRLDGRAVLVDWKTTADSSPEGFARSFVKYGYGEQLADYRHAYELITGEVCDVVVVAIETRAPYEVAVYTVGDEILAQGLADAGRHLNQFFHALTTDTWAPRVPVEEPLLLPAWATRSDDDDDFGLEA